MKHLNAWCHHHSRILIVLLVAASVAACDNQLNVSPTITSITDITAPAEALWTVQISGNLGAYQGSCVKATILFDGQEIDGARVRCEEPGGCDQLELSGTAAALTGTHTIAFKVLRQALEVEEYLATGVIDVARVDVQLRDTVTFDLQPTQETLRQGESITFELDLRDLE